MEPCIAPMQTTWQCTTILRQFARKLGEGADKNLASKKLASQEVGDLPTIRAVRHAHKAKPRELREL